MSKRRFPPPWSIDAANNACFIVRDKNGQALGYFYFEEELGRRVAARRWSCDAARLDLDQCGYWRLDNVENMRALYLPVAVVLFANPALAQSKWLESKGMAAEEIRALCERVSDVRPLARTQIMSTGDNLWRRLSRQELEIETAIMGVPPLEQNRCYVIVRAGRDLESERRAFEVRDFAVSSERTSVLVVGRNYALPRSAQP